MKNVKRYAASVVMAGALAAPVLGSEASAHHNDGHSGGNNVGQAGLVNVAIVDVLNNNEVNLSVTVPINAALAIAANVCNISADVDLAILGAIADGGDALTGTCTAENNNFAGQTIEISQAT